MIGINISPSSIGNSMPDRTAVARGSSANIIIRIMLRFGQKSSVSKRVELSLLSEVRRKGCPLCRNIKVQQPFIKSSSSRFGSGGLL